MSKVSFSRELLGTVRFVFDKTKSRTLNATQAYDTSPSQIVLASFPATASKKPLTKGFKQTINAGIATIILTTPAGTWGNLEKLPIVSGTTSLTVHFADPFFFDPVLQSVGVTKNKYAAFDAYADQPDTLCFGAAGGVAGIGVTAKSKKTKEFYYGAMTVGTGAYRAWQGKYAVLKVDLLTNKAILRVYNE